MIANKELNRIKHN